MVEAEFDDYNKTNDNSNFLDVNKVADVQRRTSQRTKKEIDEQNTRIMNFKGAKGFKKINSITDNY